jgi:hypothetical protein
MALRKPGEVATAPAAALPGASQVTDDTAKVDTLGTAKPFDYKAAEAKKIRGQVRMHSILAALQSPAGPAFSPTAEEYDKWLVKMADIAVEYTFAEEK